MVELVLKEVKYPNPNGVGESQKVVYLVDGDVVYYAGTTCGVSTHKTAFPIGKICLVEGFEPAGKKFFEIETHSGYKNRPSGVYKVSEVKVRESGGIMLAFGVIQPEAGDLPPEIKKAFLEIIGE